MLTAKQQKILLKIFVCKKLKKDQLINFFSNDSDFFHQIQPLRECGFLENRRMTNGNTEYRLTKIGSHFANFLALLDKDYEKYVKDGYIIWMP